MTALPLPVSTRWQPLRLGLKNLYRYDDERFVFAGGRLLLRGNNGTGKTRVLALTLPFLLDGEVRPARVEPDGNASRRIEWHLLMDRFHDRTGYAWIEFGRLDEGQAKYCTLGCGMRAVEGNQGLKGRWFFVSSARVDEAFTLSEPGGAPANQQRLKELLTGHGTVYDTAESYRRAVDDALFGLGQRRYEALIKLLIELRRPQLSRELNEEVLSAALTDALAPLEQTVLDDVAEVYRGLERDRDELQVADESAKAVAAFNQIHRREVAIHAGRLADGVRGAHGRYDTAQGAVRSAQEARVKAQDALEAARGRREAADNALEQAAGAKRALEASPQMRTAERLDRLRIDAESACRRAETDAAQAAERDREAHILAEDAAGAESLAGAARAEVSLTSAGAQTAGAALGIFPQDGEEAASRHKRLLDVLRTRTEAAKELVRFEAAVRREHELCSLAEQRVRDAEELRDAALRSAEEAEDALAKVRQEFASAARAYAISLVECRLDVEGTMLEVARWLDEPDGRDPLNVALSGAAAARLRVLADERAASAHARNLLEDERKDLSAEADNLRAGVDPEPAKPSHRDGDTRRNRLGAPLWRVVDFRRDVGAPARAGYEAALQASGLLDAWLSPDGRITIGADGDLHLDVQGIKRGNNGLSAVLTPAIDPSDSMAAELSAEIVARALGAIGAAADDGLCWVAPDGRWRNGPARGAWKKAAAEYLGAGARAAARQSRLDVIAEHLRLIAGETAALGGVIAGIEAAASLVQAEMNGVPDADDVRQPWLASRVKASRLAQDRELVAKRQGESSARSSKLARARATRDDFAADCGLVSWIERGAELAAALSALDVALRELARELANLSERIKTAERLTNRADEKKASAEQAATRARDSASDASTRTAEVTELKATQGAAVAELLRRLSEARARAEAAETARKAATAEEGEALRAIGRAEGEETQTQVQLQELATERSARIKALRDMAAEGLLAILGEAFHTPAPLDSTDTRILELARALAREIGDLPRDEAASDRLERDVNEAYQALLRSLSSSNLLPIADVRHGLHLVRIPFQGRDRGTAELEAMLRDDASQRRLLFTAREREVIENFLLDEAADHLHGLLHEAEKWVATVNGELASRPMSTGMALRFQWKAADDAPQGTVEARERLLRPSHAWSAEDRAGLASFLQKRITASREETPGATWQEQLATALDYRRWHRFSIDRRDHTGRWVRLTKRTHGTASGGEKAVALTMPQFAAAAAHYHASANAPRLILLDEAFVGIDNDMRRQCLGLLAAFDLDVVMTSEREWGCYDTVPSLAIYQLASAASGDCIATTRYVWDGRKRIQDVAS